LDYLILFKIAEGMLTYATAILLKEKLEADGATVFLTRQKNGYTAFGKTFDDWLKDDYKNKVEELHKSGKLST
jgi:N-acetylmuramoyl-L-alanine amidase